MFFKRKPLSGTGYCSVAKASWAGVDVGWTVEDNPFLLMTEAQRAWIVRHRFSNFNPTGVGAVEEEFKKKYSSDWWKQEIQHVGAGGKRLNGDLAHFVVNACLFPKRSQPDWEPGSYEGVIDFYCGVTRENALTWYLNCPLHLRKSIDAKIEAEPSAKEAPATHPAYLHVKEKWGDRPVMRYCEEDLGKGELLNHPLELEWFNQWCYEYDRWVLANTCVEMAPGMQKERKMLSEALGLGKTGELPEQYVGLEDDVQSATVRWIQQSGQTPLEFLADTYRDEGVRMGDRIQAAKTLMDFVHKKIPQKQEKTEGAPTPPKVDLSALKGLSEKELELLEQLLSKLGDRNG